MHYELNLISIFEQFLLVSTISFFGGGGGGGGETGL